ncbi:hypothetical protein ACH4D5_26270 [Streptomyces sp. NPDC018029]|uniref:hypothetical protein n=1 Tax=Streptomyces sp. NPDC018029 TaxID=3365032 RepID=UPI0037BA1ED2
MSACDKSNALLVTTRLLRPVSFTTSSGSAGDNCCASAQLIGDDDTDDIIVRHAQNVADGLTQQAAKIHTSLAVAHMVTPFERTS